MTTYGYWWEKINVGHYLDLKTLLALHGLMDHKISKSEMVEMFDL